MNLAVRGYDKHLFAKRENTGAIHIYRQTLRSADPIHFVFALTDTWTVHGKPVYWGVDVVVNRLRAHDLWKDETIVDRLMKEQVKQEESAERSRANTTEAFLYEFRSQFARATDEINTGSLAKLDSRRNKGA